MIEQGKDFKLVSLIQEMFQDKNLYKDRIMNDLIEKNQSGFVSISQIVKHWYFKNNMEEILQQQDDIIFLQHQKIQQYIQQYSKKLIVKNLRVRRLIPFVNIIKTHNIKPVYIDHLPSHLSEEQLFQILSNYTHIYKIDYLQKQNQAFVFCQNPLSLYALNKNANFFDGKVILMEFFQVEGAYKALSMIIKRQQEKKYKKRLLHPFTNFQKQLSGPNIQEEDDEASIFYKEKKKKIKIKELQNKRQKIKNFNNQALLSRIQH